MPEGLCRSGSLLRRGRTWRAWSRGWRRRRACVGRRGVRHDGDSCTFGAYAEYAVLDQSAVAFKPKTLDFVQAAAIPMGALTAWQGIVEAGGLKTGDHLFVHAAAGNVGGMAVQIAHALGAHVTAAASAEARPLVEGYGAKRFVDYRAERFENAVHDQDIVFDTLAGEMQARSWGLLKQGAILVSTLGIADPDQAKARASVRWASAARRTGRS